MSSTPRLASLVCLLLGAFFAACGDGDAPEPVRDDGPPRPPNVLVLVLDTLRADRCSFLGYERPTTPFLDRLARDGTAFAECWSASSWTGPAHATLFTGKRPENHGYIRGRRKFLAEAEVTLAERFLAAGYATMGVSNNPNVSETTHLNQGFARWRELATLHDQPMPAVPGEASGPVKLPSTVPGVRFRPSADGHEIAATWAALRHRAREPFLLFVNDMEPHLTYEPEKEHQRRFVASGTPAAELQWARNVAFPFFVGHNLGIFRVPDERLRLLSDLYDAEIATLDAELEALFERLRKDGVLDDTIVVILSDHGENLGEHGLLDHMCSLHRTLLHVPLLVVLPERLRDRLPAGEVVRDLVRVEDVLPTLLELCELPAAEGIDGASLLRDLPGRTSYAAVDGPTDDMIRHVATFFPGVTRSGPLVSQRSFTDGRVHLIRYGDGREELYDLVADPAERHDLAPARGPRLDAARDMLSRVHPVVPR